MPCWTATGGCVSSHVVPHRSRAVPLVTRWLSCEQEGLSLAESKELVKACIKQLHTRFLMHQPNFTIKVVDADGVREVSLDDDDE